ncbi:MAG: ABC transporter permease [Bryobacterales bacterium]|nr:ABC transporter permease [Bryobacterales bacterium]
MDTLLRDARQSLRSLLKSPGFTLSAVSALALGVGLNTAIFSLLNTILLKPLPFPDPGRIVQFTSASPQNPNGSPGSSPAKFAHFASQTAVTHNASAFRTGLSNWTGGQAPEQLRNAQVSRHFFRLFGAAIIRGREFTAEEDLPNGRPAVIVSQPLWQRRFHAAPDIIGRSMQLGGVPHTIVGVVSDRFDFRDFGPQPDVYVPFQLDPQTGNQGHYFTNAARLNPGVPLLQAQQRVKASSADFRARFPGALGNDQRPQHFFLQDLSANMVRNAKPTLMVLAAAVGLVLLIACANVANLLLARAVGRKREFAIRAAIGAGRPRLVRQLLVESLLIGAAGALLGSLLGVAAMRALLTVNTAGLPRLGEEGALLSLDWRVLAFTAALALLTSLLFGLVPAWHSARTDLSLTLKEAGGRGGSGFRHNKARTVLVTVEIALAVVLVTGAGLLIRTLIALAAVEPGFDPRNVLTMRMSLNAERFHTSAAVEQLIRNGVARLSALPGVELASATCCVPLEGGYGLPFRVMGRPLNDGPFHGGAGWQTVSPGYFEVFRVPVARGRTFTDRDSAAGPPVAIVNQAMAKQYWPKGDPLNDTILIGKGIMPQLATEVPRQIVGIVADMRDGALNQNPQPVMYIPNGQVPDALNTLNIGLTPLAWVIRTRGEPGALAQAATEELRQASGLPLAEIRTMEEIVSRSTSRQRFNMLLMTVFGASALLLAAIGVYGLISYSVEQRLPEIGIRLALGAAAGQMWRMVIGEGMRFVLAGLALGAGAAYWLAKFVESFIFGVTVRDPFVFILVPIALLLVALAAIAIPAWRATRVDPVSALRYE